MFQKWILCDFHIHTSFSDGILSLTEVVDLYGQHGFDVIGISDHIVDEKWRQKSLSMNRKSWWIEPDQISLYFHAIWAEAKRAWKKYRMLVIPGAELTNNSHCYHILAIDIKDYIQPDASVERIVSQIHNQGGIAVVPHPHRRAADGSQEIMYIWNNQMRFVNLFDAWEVANRDDLFNVVGLKKFNYIANSDFHKPRHLFSWKTLLLCDKNPEAVKAVIRDNSGVSIYLFRPDKNIKKNNNIENIDIKKMNSSRNCILQL